MLADLTLGADDVPWLVRLYERTRLNGDCVLWTGSMRNPVRKAGDRGCLTIKLDGKKRTATPYRLIWEMWNGPIPKGGVLHHTCRKPACVNLQHLRLMSHSTHKKLHYETNPQPRGEASPRWMARCKRGHERTEENTYRRTRKTGPGAGQVMCSCRICRSIDGHAYRLAQRSK